MAAAVSPMDAAQRAIEHTRRSLFPFRFERWLLLGFVAFLDQCGRSGGSLPSNFPGGGGSSGGGHGTPPEISEAIAWASSHVAMIVGVAAGALLVLVLFTALVLWINCRGIFMYIEAVARAPRELGVRFSAHAEAAQSLFAWRFTLAMATLVTVLVLLGAGAFCAMLFMRGRLQGVALFAVAAVLVLTLVAVAVVASLVSVFLRDFVAPLQWRRGLVCGAAVREAASLLSPHKGAVAVYLLLKIAFVMVAGIAALVAGCLTCCCAFLPVLAQTALQPLFFFERSWSLFLLEQLGVSVFDVPEGARSVPLRP
jgi:hypothetical protein